MASKLRRASLFGYTEGNVCVKAYQNSTVTCSKRQNSGVMECGIANAYSAAAAAAAAGPGTPNGIMSGGGGGAGVGVGERSPAKAGLRVNFSDKGEVKERREKFLTAKYGHHQMSLIRKRLAVEMWLYEELKKLYETSTVQDECSRNDEVEVDIDELLDMDTDDERRTHLQALLTNAKKSQSDVKKFINDLLDKAKTL